eukprot:6206880-Pleurochrysis_carterae.AAC.4
MIAHDACQAIFKCPESVSARAAASPKCNCDYCTSRVDLWLGEALCMSTVLMGGGDNDVQELFVRLVAPRDAGTDSEHLKIAWPTTRASNGSLALRFL